MSRIALNERRHSADFGWRADQQPEETQEPKSSSSKHAVQHAGHCSNASTPTVTMSHFGSEADGDWQLQAMRLENKEVDLRCSETEAMIQSKVRQLQRGREQLIKEQKQLQEMQRALKKRQMHEQQVSLEAMQDEEQYILHTDVRELGAQILFGFDMLLGWRL
eukprot:g29935.t1